MSFIFSRKALLKVVVTAFSTLLLAVFAGVFAADASAVTTSCDVYSGSNVEAQDYTYYWSQPAESYLAKCSDGRLMRIQNTDNDGIIVEYYDSSFNYKETRKIPAELPIFGAFYETDSNYYLLTGQNNPNLSASVECYRLTKYDKSWNRIISIGLFDCNTYIPFDAGSARITELGKYLIVRTCHEMYNGHQANVTIEFDTESMTVTDSYCGVMNVNYGYVSHSFNQFIAVEGNQIVALDHGDAYPRSIALIKYNTDASTGKFFPGYYNTCSYYSMLDIPGDVGANYTGVKVGGFELSDTAYIAAGAKVDFDNDNSPKVYNIFVSTIKKGETVPTVTTLTSYTSSSLGGDVTTPHLVKVDNGKYMLLWSKGDVVYYTMLDGNGNQTGSIYSMNGNLSDCKPIVYNGNLVWYTWTDANTTFYKINLSNLSANGKTFLTGGHKYVDKGLSSGKQKVVCSACSDAKLVDIPTYFTVYWLSKTDGRYWPSFNLYYLPGDELIYSISDSSGNGISAQYVFESSDPSVVSCKDGYLKMNKAGTATITVYVKYNPSIKGSATIKVLNDFKITDLSLGGRSSTALRLNWSQSVNADGYIVEKYDGSKWVRIAKLTKNITTTYRVSGLKSGTAYKFRVRAYKMNGTAAQYSSYSATIAARTNPSAVSGLKLGGRSSNALRLNWTKNPSADGYIIEQYKSGKWVRIAKFTSNATTTYRVTGLSAGTAYKFRMKAYKMSGSTALYSSYTSTLAARTNPSDVTGLKIGGKASTALRLNWNKNTSADGYIVEMYRGGKWVRIKKLASNSKITLGISGLAKNTTYKFRVKAYKMSGTTALYSGYTTISGKTTA